MAIFAGLAIAGIGAGIAGDLMQQGGVQDTNAANAQINQNNIDAAMTRQLQSENFNGTQADLARTFSAQQVAQQENFQQDTQQRAMDYNTQMSDTAMQRRAADLKAAGLNPLLAVGQGGASAPIVSGLQGNVANAAQASANPAGQGTGIAMQNPASAFGNLGGIVNSSISAATTGAQIDLMHAQAAKLNAESGNEIPAQVDYLKSMTGLNDQQSTQAYTNTQLLQEKIYGQRLDNDMVRDATAPMAQQNLQVLKATRDALISAQQSDAAAKQLNLAGLRNLNDVQQGNLGKVLTYLNAILGPISTGAKAAGVFIP